jgi:hypothetical protein
MWISSLNGFKTNKIQRGISMEKKLTPLKAIKAHCIECSGGTPQEARLCETFNCSLHSFRLGKNSNIKRALSEDAKRALRERFKKNMSVKD